MYIVNVKTVNGGNVRCSYLLPLWQEFLFDLVMPLGSLLDKVFTIGVVHKPRNPFKSVQMIGTAKIGKLLLNILV